MRNFDIATSVLLFIGAINWGLLGLFDFNLVHLFIESPWVERLLYIIIGVAAIYRAVYYKSIRNRTKKD